MMNTLIIGIDHIFVWTKSLLFLCKRIKNTVIQVMHIAFANTKVSSTKNNAGDVAIDSLLHDCIEFLPKVSPLRTRKIEKNDVENNKTRIMCAINKCEDRMCKQMNSEQKHSYIFFLFHWISSEAFSCCRFLYFNRVDEPEWKRMRWNQFNFIRKKAGKI